MSDSLLLVGANPEVLAPIHLQARQIGCDVVSASDLVSAFSMISRSHFDVIITESRCPGGDVVQFIERIHRLRPLITVVVLASAGSSNPDSAFLTAGASAVLPSPPPVGALTALWEQRNQASQVHGVKSSGRTILMVEDDDEVRRGLGLRLKAHGYEPIFATDGISAIRASQQQPDVVLLDLGLPGGDGFSVLQRLKQTMPWLPVIVFTGRESVENRERALQAGARFFLTKPSTNEEILDCIQQALGQGPSR